MFGPGVSGCWEVSCTLGFSVELESSVGLKLCGSAGFPGTIGFAVPYSRSYKRPT